MNFSNELHEVAKQANANKLTPYQLVINSFSQKLQNECKEAAKEGRNSINTIFCGSYDDEMFWMTTVSRFGIYEDAIPYRDAAIEIIKQLGFSSYKVEIEQYEIHTKGLFCNGIGYFLKQLFDRDYYIKIHVEW